MYVGILNNICIHVLVHYLHSSQIQNFLNAKLYKYGFPIMIRLVANDAKLDDGDDDDIAQSM